MDEQTLQIRREYEDAERRASKSFRQLRNQEKISNRLSEEHPDDYELENEQIAKLSQLADDYFKNQTKLLQKIKIYIEANEKLPPEDRQDLSAIYDLSDAREEQYNQSFDYLHPIPAEASHFQNGQQKPGFLDAEPNEDESSVVYESEETDDDPGNVMTEEEAKVFMKNFESQEQTQPDTEEQSSDEKHQENEKIDLSQDSKTKNDATEQIRYEDIQESYKGFIKTAYQQYLNGEPQSLEAIGTTLSHDDLKKALFELAEPDQGVIIPDASTKEDMLKELLNVSTSAVDLGRYGNSPIALAAATAYAYKNIDVVMKQMEQAGIRCTTKEIESIGQDKNTSSIFTSMETLHDLAAKYPNVIEEVAQDRQISEAEQNHRNFQQSVMETLHDLGENGCRKKAMELIRENDKLNHVERSEADYNKIVQSKLLGSKMKREYSESRSTYTPGAILNWTDAGNREHRVNYVTLAKIAVEKELLEKIAKERGISADSKELRGYTTFQTGEMNAMVNRTVDMADAYQIAQTRENMREMMMNDPRAIINGLGEKEIYEQWREEVKYMPSTKIRGQLETYSEARERMSIIERDKAREIDDLQNEPTKLDPMLADRLAALYQEQYPNEQPNMDDIQKIIEDQHFNSYNERLDFADNMNQNPEKYLEQIHAIQSQEQAQDLEAGSTHPESEYEGVGEYQESVKTEKVTHVSFGEMLQEMKNSAHSTQTKTTQRTETTRTSETIER